MRRVSSRFANLWPKWNGWIVKVSFDEADLSAAGYPCRPGFARGSILIDSIWIDLIWIDLVRIDLIWDSGMPAFDQEAINLRGEFAGPGWVHMGPHLSGVSHCMQIAQGRINTGYFASC